MFRKVTCFLALFVIITNAAIIIEEDYSTEGSDVAPQTINDISFGNLVDAAFSDMATKEESLGAENGALPQSTDVSKIEESDEKDAFPSFPNFDFEMNFGDSSGDEYSYYYTDDDDDTWEDPEYAEQPYEVIFPSPDEGEGEKDSTGDTFVIDFPDFGSIFGSSPPTRSNGPRPSSDFDVDSHPASDASVDSAVTSMFATPHSDRYQNDAYEAMTEVRTKCKADFEQMCTPRTLDSFLGNGIFSLLSSAIMAPMFAAPQFSFAPRTRRLFNSEPQGLGSLLDKLKGHMEHVKHELGGAASDMKPELDMMASKFAHFRNGFKKLQEHGGNDFHEQRVPADLAGPRDPKFVPIDSPSKFLEQGEMRIQSPVGSVQKKNRVLDRHLLQGKLRGHQKKSQEPKRHLDESSRHEPCHHDHSDHPPFWSSQAPREGWRSSNGDEDAFEWGPDHPWEEDQDESYNGELLWGPLGDRCMYENFDSLSEQCQDSIIDVYALREQYMDEEDGKRSHGAFVVFVIILCIVVIYTKRQRRLAKYEKELAMYNAMEANPELKAQMEKASGVVMEKPQRCGAKGCGFFFLKIVLSVLSALLAIQFAVFVTVIVYENNIVVDEYGNEQLPPPILPFLTFMLALLGASFFMAFLFSKCFRKQRNETVEAAAPPSPSPPPPPSTWSMPNLRLPAWINRPSSRDYAALSGESVHGDAAGNEMVVITPSAPVPRAVVVQQNYPSTAAVVSPVNLI